MVQAAAVAYFIPQYLATNKSKIPASTESTNPPSFYREMLKNNHLDGYFAMKKSLDVQPNFFIAYFF